MKKHSLLLLCLLGLFCLAAREAQARLPVNYQDFKARYQTEGRTPDGALKLYFEAVFCYIDPATRGEGSKMLRYALHLGMPLEQSRNSATFVSRMKDPDYNYVFRSFCVGATPENSYAMSPDSFSLQISGRQDGEGYLKLYLVSSGADSPRLIWMRQYDGLWYTENNAGTYSQVRPPQSELDKKKNAHDSDYDAVPAPKPASTHGTAQDTARQSAPNAEGPHPDTTVTSGSNQPAPAPAGQEQLRPGQKEEALKDIW